MILGIAIAIKSQDNAEALYVEYHRCDQCSTEYRVYLHSLQAVENAYRELAKVLGNPDNTPDLCYNCQEHIIANQGLLMGVNSE